jgi:hypothetical protein
MEIDPLRLAIALVPLAAYTLVLGLINLRRQPLVVSGGSDLCAVGIALSGLMFIGPMELFRPEAATIELGNYVWALLLALYLLVVLLAMLVARPRIVIYNIGPEELHPVLAQAASRLDAEARWAGNHLSLPRLGVQLHLDSLDIMRNVSLVSSGGRQSIEGWRRLTRELGSELGKLRVKSNPRAFGFLLGSAALITVSLSQMLRHPIELAQAMREVFAY